MTTHTYRRLSDEVRRFGPIEISERDAYRPVSISLESGDDEYSGCSLTLRALGWSVRVRLPAVLKPYREWIDTSKYEWSRNPNGGYWDVHRREFSLYVNEGYVHLHYGPQTNDSSTTKGLCREIPWMAWRYDTTRLFDDRGALVWIQQGARQNWDEQHAAEKALSKVRFAFKDFDGEDNIVTTHITQREWLKGRGWFKWLSLVVPRMVRRSLELNFEKEVGPEKGSWKGGTTGHSIEMLSGELHEAAFRRYCEQDHRSKYRPYRITFVGKVEA